jgi:ParB family chromosome partitioning protein
VAKPELKPKLASVDELLFTTQAERDDLSREKVTDVPISMIDDFPNHPFHVRIDDEMRELVENIREYGVLTPAITRIKDDGRYELVSGHRRKAASKLAGLKTLPVITRELSHDEAVLLMVNANMQRERILPSEKGYAYKMKLNALKRQGERIDLTSSQVGTKLRSDETLAIEVGESRNQIQRYIRLTELIPELLQMVDDGKISLNPAVEISYLPKEEQTTLLGIIEMELTTPSVSQARKLKEFSREGRLNPDVILSIMKEEKPNQREPFKMSREKLARYFEPETPPQKMEEIILQALELYRKRERNRRMER